MSRILQALDHWGQPYSMQLDDYIGDNFSKKCFLFPGQGSVEVSKFNGLLEGNPAIRLRLEAADRFAKKMGYLEPTAFFTKVSADHADYFAVKNICLLAIELGIYDASLRTQGDPTFITGHSFGECAAWVASGQVDYETMLSIIYTRDRCYDETSKSAQLLTATGDIETLLRVLPSQMYQPAIRNSGAQLTIAVDKSLIKNVLTILRSHSIQVVSLEGITHPFHSGFMAESARRFKSELKNLRFSLYKSSATFLSFSTDLVVESNHVANRDDFENAMVCLLDKSRDFSEQMEKAYQYGARTFIEMTFQQKCSAWLADIFKAKPYKTLSLDLNRGIVAPAPAKKKYNERIVSGLKDIVARVTGYSIEEVSMEKSLREDLGMDSIKTMEIAFEFMETQGLKVNSFKLDVPISQIRRVEDFLQFSKVNPPAAESANVHFDLYERSWDFLATEALSENFDRKSIAMLGIGLSGMEMAKQLSADTQIVAFYSDKIFRGFAHFIESLQALSLQSGQYPLLEKIVFVSALADPPDVQGLSAFLLSYSKELGVDFQSISIPQDLLSVPENLIKHGVLGLKESSLKFFAGRWMKKRLEKLPLRSSDKQENLVTALAIGGLRGITRVLLDSLVTKGLENLVVIGRRDWSEVQSDVNNWILSSGLNVRYVAGDAGQLECLEKAFELAHSEFGDVDLVIHGGGVEIPATVQAIRATDISEQLGIKIETVLHLANVQRKFGFKRVVCFSSVVSEMGNPAQSVYSYANAVMENRISQIDPDRKLFTVIAWPAWDRIGMTAKEENYKALQLGGHDFLSEQEGKRIFEEAIFGAAKGSYLCLSGTNT